MDVLIVVVVVAHALILDILRPGHLRSFTVVCLYFLVCTVMLACLPDAITQAGATTIDEKQRQIDKATNARKPAYMQTNKHNTNTQGKDRTSELTSQGLTNTKQQTNKTNKLADKRDRGKQTNKQKQTKRNRQHTQTNKQTNCKLTNIKHHEQHTATNTKQTKKNDQTSITHKQ